MNTSFVNLGLQSLRANKAVLVFFFNFRGKLSIIRCDKELILTKSIYMSTKYYISDIGIGKIRYKIEEKTDQPMIRAPLPQEVCASNYTI